MGIDNAIWCDYCGEQIVGAYATLTAGNSAPDSSEVRYIHTGTPDCYANVQALFPYTKGPSTAITIAASGTTGP